MHFLAAQNPQANTQCTVGLIRSQSGVRASRSDTRAQAEHTELHHRLLASTTAEHAALEEVERLRAAAERMQVSAPSYQHASAATSTV